MDIELTEEQRQVQGLCRDFAERELRPNARRWDAEHTFPAGAVRQLAELGLMGIMVPPDWGGAGMDAVAYAVAMEEISRGCAGTGGHHERQQLALLRPGPAPRHRRAEEGVPRALRPRGEAGGLRADRAHQRLRRGRDEDQRRAERATGYVLDGTKNFITNGPQADAVLVFAVTDREKRHRGLSAFLVPTDTPGFTRGKPDEKVGIRASGSCTVFFERCALPARCRLGAEGEGFAIAMGALDGGRIGIAAQALGIARAALEEAIAYARERRSFGKPIAQHQAIQFMLADMATELDAARLLVWRAAARKDRGQRFTSEAAMAKLHASETCERVTSHALQIHGGYGYVKDYDVERHWRDGRITEIYEGTSEIQRLVIAAGLLRE